MNLSDVVDAMEAIAPTRFAESWDNVGLLIGDRAQPVSRGLLTIDYTDAVAEERARLGADFVIAYHPPLFRPIKRVVRGELAFDAARAGVGIYSPHTAWDVAAGGVNDLLGDIVGLTEREPLRAWSPPDDELKLVTFVPPEHHDRVMTAIFEAGAGRIGNYTECSFRTAGTGTFFGNANSHPVVGEVGRREDVSELRVECVLPLTKADAVVRALRAAHPYEEPAFDLVRVAPRVFDTGIGRVGPVRNRSRTELLAAIKAGLGVDRLLVSGPLDGEVRRAAACAGSGGDLLSAALAKRADLYLTGEIRHHDALLAASRGMTVVCALHSGSERASLRGLRDRLAELLPNVPLHISTADRDPFSFV